MSSLASYLFFLEPEEHGAKGYYAAVKCAINYPYEFEKILRTMSSIVTDGASINTGSRNGLWALLEEDKTNGSSATPLLKIWCAVHRSALVWEALTERKTAVCEVDKTIKFCD